MVEYTNNGLTWDNVDAGAPTTPGSVRFPFAPATPEALAKAFPGYTLAMEIQALTAQIATIQAQIYALDGGAQARSVRTGLIAVLPAGNGDLARLQALESSIVPLRAQIAPLQTQLTAAQAALTAATVSTPAVQ